MLIEKKKDYQTELEDRFNDIDPKDLEEADLKCKEAEAWVESSRRKLSQHHTTVRGSGTASELGR